jgi:hypothetical protein
VLLEKSETSASSWWVVYHGWAAFCLFFVLKSGGLLGAISEPLLAGALSAAAGAVGYYFSKYLVSALDNSSIRKGSKTVIKFGLPIIYFAVGALVFKVIAFESHGPQTASTLKSWPADTFITGDAVQSAEGYTDANLDDTFLANTKAWLLKTMTEGARQEYAKSGYDPSSYKPKLLADARYLQLERGKLALITARSTGVRAVWVIGIKGDQFHRISCLRKSDADVSVTQGACAEEIFKVFGVRLHDTTTNDPFADLIPDHRGKTPHGHF